MAHRKGDCLWTAEQVAVLKSLVTAKVPPKEIGRRLKLSLGAVYGKIMRLGLSEASPKLEPRPKRRRVVSSPIPAVVVPAERHTAGGRAIPMEAGKGSHNRAPIRAATLVGVVGVAPPPAFIRPPKACCWVTSGGRPWTFCDGPAVPGKPYCADHVAVAFVKPVARGEAGAETESGR